MNSEAYIVPDEQLAGVPVSAVLSDAQGKILVLPDGKVTILESGRGIFGAIAESRKLFFRGGKVHEILSEGRDAKRLEPVTPTRFRSVIEAHGTVMAWRAGKDGSEVLKKVLCPEQTASALLASDPAREMLPHIAVLSGCPVLARTNEGPRVLASGWHDFNGGLYVTGGDEPPAVPLEEAVRALRGILEDFDFAGPGDRSRAVASLISPALYFGGWLRGHLPIDIGEADQSQSGKTYRQKIIAAIYRETCNVVTQRSGGVGGLDESISQKLIDGRPFVLLDNLRGKFDSPYLESVLTAPGTMPARVPHRGEVKVDPRGFVFQLTSNGVETTRDLANRSNHIRIRKRPSSYAFRTFPEGDLHAHVTARQGYYLGCVFSVLWDWIQRGEPRTDEARHDFRDWAQRLDWIVCNTFGEAPLLEGFSEARERVSDPRRTWLRLLCIKVREENKAGDFSASDLAERCLEWETMPPGASAASDTKSLSLRIGIVMGQIFKESSEIEVDGFKIRRERRYVQSCAKEMAFYRFE